MTKSLTLKPKSHANPKQTSLSLSLSLWFSLSYAQPIEIFSLIDRNGLSFNAEQDSFFQSTDFDTSFLGYECLEMNVSSIEYLSDVYYDITELGGYHEYYVIDIRYDGDFVTWVGKSYDSYKNGHLVLIQHGEHFGGFISEEEHLWQLFPNGDSLMLAIIRDPAVDHLFPCALEESPDPSDEEEVPDPCQIPPDDCHAHIRVLLEMTPEAHDWLELFIDASNPVDIETGKQLFYNTLEVSINIALKNSRIYNKEIKIAAIENIEFSYNYEYFPTIDETRGDIVQDINDLQSLGSLFSNLSGNRCDVAIMLTNQNYPFYAGIVNEIGPPDAFCGIVEIKYALGNLFVFAHEIGHLFGARHEYAADPADICNHAWQLNTGGEFDVLTLMHTTDNNDDQTLLHLSNPFVKVNGVRTGTLSDYNAAAVDNNGCYIEDYEPDPFWRIHIAGRDTLCDTIETDAYYFAEVNEPGAGNPGQPSYSYIWQHGYVWNDTNFPDLDWVNESNQGSVYEIPYDPEELNKELFVRLVVVSSEDLILMAVKHVRLFPYGCDSSVVPWPQEEWEPRSIKDTYVINQPCDYVPFLSIDQSGYHFSVISGSSPIEQVQLTDILGRQRAVWNGVEFISRAEMEDLQLTEGIYIVSMYTTCGVVSKKIYIRQ